MITIAKQLTELVGNTPLLELNKYSRAKGLETPVIAKVEFFNPGGSVKDRIALAMIEDAEQKGILKPGATIIEPTSGNTGVGLALISAVKGYHLILTMPETMSVERRNLVKAYGAEVRLTPGKDGMTGAIRAAEKLRDEIPGSVILQQFENAANPARHYATTGPEIWQATGGKIDIFVAGVGTGGTVSGTGKYLKEQNPEVQIIAVEPKSSPVLNGGQSGPHKIQGIGAGFVPKTYDSKVIDEVFDVENDDALRTAREVARQEGLLVGISAGAALYAAIEVAKRPENRDKKIVVLLPDTGERYLSTELYATKTKDIFLAGGCFWGTEHFFKQIEGVEETEVGFANGNTPDPTYKEVYTDTTGYAETVHVKYNPDVVSLEFLLKMFFKAIDPTSLNKQGHDEGTRYRTGIYYTNAEDLPVIEKVFAEEQTHYHQPLAVEKLPLQNFYTAEEYHQDYLDKNPTGYCHLPESLFEFARKAKDRN